MVFFMLALSPIVEYVDPENAGWDEGFARFAVHIWWPPVSGPTWFLGVLLLFSAVYAVLRTAWRRRTAGATPPRAWQLAIAASVVALASYAVRIVVPRGEERWHLALGQAPAWVFGFALGVLAAERGWLDPLEPLMARRVRDVAWTALVGSSSWDWCWRPITCSGHPRSSTRRSVCSASSAPLPSGRSWCVCLACPAWFEPRAVSATGTARSRSASPCPGSCRCPGRLWPAGTV